VFKRRLLILLAGLVLAGVTITARLAVIQAGGERTFVHSDFMRVGGDYLVETVRGGIYTSEGVPLAEEVPSFDLGVRYADLPEDTWLQIASGLTGAEPEELRALADETIRRVERIRDNVRRRHQDENIRVREEFEYYALARDLPTEAAVAVRTQPERSAGMQVLERTRRLNPNGDLAAHITGRVGPVSPEAWRELEDQHATWSYGMGLSTAGRLYRVDDGLGISGVEKQYEDVLRGSRGYVVNRLSIGALKVETHQEQTPPRPGMKVYLTLREGMQRAANVALRHAAEDPTLEFHAGALVVIDVRSGAILAAATWPTYDLATFRRDYAALSEDPARPLFFRPFQAALPSGSIYKIITAIAALEEGKATPATTHTCHRVTTFHGRAFHCTGFHGALDLLPAIERSCNIYFYHTGLAAGAEALAGYGRMFGLGVPGGLDWPHVAAGSLPTPRVALETVNLSIGQGRLLCTPVQVANMMAAVANGGRLFTPHLLGCVRDADGGTVSRYEPRWRDIPVDAEKLAVVREGMRRVIYGSRGTARNAGLEPYGVAGKTGSAETGRTGVLHAWFAGFAPHDAPKIAFAVVNEATPGHGGTHAAPIVADLLGQIWDDVERMP